MTVDKSVTWMVLVAAIVGVASMIGCERQGPAEQAGEEIDRAVDAAKDATN